MCGEFGEVTAIIGLVIIFLALGTLLLNSRDTLVIYMRITNFGAWPSLVRIDILCAHSCAILCLCLDNSKSAGCCRPD